MHWILCPQVIFPIPIDIISNMMAKKRGVEEPTSGEEGKVRHQQLDQQVRQQQQQQVRRQQLHHPAPLHQHQLHVKVGQFVTKTIKYN